MQDLIASEKAERQAHEEHIGHVEASMQDSEEMHDQVQASRAQLTSDIEALHSQCANEVALRDMLHGALRQRLDTVEGKLGGELTTFVFQFAAIYTHPSCNFTAHVPILPFPI